MKNKTGIVYRNKLNTSLKTPQYRIEKNSVLFFFNEVTRKEKRRGEVGPPKS